MYYAGSDTSPDGTLKLICKRTDSEIPDLLITPRMEFKKSNLYVVDQEGNERQVTHFRTPF